MKAVNYNPALITPAAAFDKSKQRNYTEERAKIEKRCQQYLEAEMALDPFTASIPSEIRKKLPTDSPKDICANPKTY